MYPFTQLSCSFSRFFSFRNDCFSGTRSLSKPIALVGVLGVSVLSSTVAMADKNLVVFGHNPYEQGNFPSLVGALDNTFTGESGNRIGTGPSIADVVSRELAASGVIEQESQADLFSAQGTGFGVATATTRLREDALSPLIGYQAQINRYLAGSSASEIKENLYLYAPGQNDVLDAVGTGQFPLLSCDFSSRKYSYVYRKTRHNGGDYTGHFEGTEYERVAEIMYATINATTTQLDQLHDAGATDILIPNVVSPSQYPVIDQLAAGFGCSVKQLSKKADLLSRQFNQSLERYLRRSDNSKAVVYNVARDVRQLKANGSTFGFSDVSNNCYLVDVSIPQIFLNPAVSCNDDNENSFLHYTALTLTADADDFIGRKMAATLRLMAR